jgi:hypothetical protein
MASMAQHFERSAAVLHRDGVTAADKLVAGTLSATKQDGVVGVMAASEHKCAVSPGNRYGSILPGTPTAVTPTLNKTADFLISPCFGAEWYDLFFTTDAAPKWVGRVTEAQRVAGAAVTAVGTVGAGGAAGTKQVETLTVTHGASKAGTITIKVTSAAIGAAVNVPVAVLATDDTVNEVAAKIRAALAADATITSRFTVGGTNATATLTAIYAAANDSTLAIELPNDGSTGVTVGSSTDTTGGVAGVKQVETATAAGTVTTAGNALVTVTSALFAEAEAVDVPVEVDDDANAIALAIRTALAANETVAEHFTVSGTNASVILTAKVEAANDTTLNIAIDDGSGEGASAGVTAASSSANTTAGVAPVCQAETISVTAGAARAGTLLVTVTAAGMTGSPRGVNVPLTAYHSTTALVADEVRKRLAADAVIAAFFAVSGTNADIVLTALADAANDATMAIALTNDASTGVTVAASDNTTAGVAPSVNVRLVGTGVATDADPFKVSNAYKLDEIEEIQCTGKSKAEITVKMNVSDLRSLPTVSIVPFVKDAAAPDYVQLAKQDVTLLTAAGKSLIQTVSVDLYGADYLKVAVDAITGQGASADIYVALV